MCMQYNNLRVISKRVYECIHIIQETEKKFIFTTAVLLLRIMMKFFFAQGKRGCAPVMCQYGFRWPKTMRCRHFPKANGNRLRVDRNAMVRNSALTITRQQEIPKQKRGKIVKNGISSWLLSLPVLEVELQSKVIFQCGYVRSYL